MRLRFCTSNRIEYKILNEAFTKQSSSFSSPCFPPAVIYRPSGRRVAATYRRPPATTFPVGSSGATTTGWCWTRTKWVNMLMKRILLFWCPSYLQVGWWDSRVNSSSSSRSNSWWSRIHSSFGTISSCPTFTTKGSPFISAVTKTRSDLTIHGYQEAIPNIFFFPTNCYNPIWLLHWQLDVLEQSMSEDDEYLANEQQYEG